MSSHFLHFYICVIIPQNYTSLYTTTQTLANPAVIDKCGIFNYLLQVFPVFVSSAPPGHLRVSSVRGLLASPHTYGRLRRPPVLVETRWALDRRYPWWPPRVAGPNTKNTLMKRAFAFVFVHFTRQNTFFFQKNAENQRAKLIFSK